jgi:hypothetical protein
MMGWMAPLRHRRAKLVFLASHQEREPSMREITTIGLDLAQAPVREPGLPFELHNSAETLSDDVYGQTNFCRRRLQAPPRQATSQRGCFGKLSSAGAVIHYRTAENREGARVNDEEVTGE